VEIKFIPEAENDYKSLDGSIKKIVNEKIDKLKNDPYIGEELGNKNNIMYTIHPATPSQSHQQPIGG